MAKEVRVPAAEHRMSAAATEYWHALGGFIVLARARLGDEQAMMVLVSRVSRELRRLYGIEGARKILAGYIETMAEAGQYDVKDDTEGGNG
jgi:hypothetical protein